MEQLIFVGIVVLFSILEAVGRKKKARGGEAEEVPPAPLPAPRGEGRAPGGPRTSVPGPESYDDDVVGRGASSGGPQRPGQGGDSSEGLIPANVWEEIAALARGEVPQTPRPEPSARPAPTPQPTPRLETTPSTKPAPSAKPAPATTAGRAPHRAPPLPKGREARAQARARPEPSAPSSIRGRPASVPARPPDLALEELRPDHPLHGTHAGLGVPGRDRRTDFPGDTSARRWEDLAAIRSLLVSGNTASLRKAIILGEILGPPSSMKEQE